jgi:Tol biopolymer transport system component
VTAPATGGTGGGDAVQPSWSPHGARVAFWGMRGEGGQRDIFTVAVRGAGAGRPLLITDDVATDWNPVWSPDGRYLYFASTRGGTMNLWRLAIDEDSGRVLGEPEAITTPATWSGDISFSRDGRRIAFATLDWRSTIKKVSFDPDAGRLAGTPITLLSTTRPITNPHISPDGRSVVFQTSGAQEDILLVRMDGSGFRHLTNDVFKDRRPRWSPDGHAINFISDRGKKYEIWTIRPDGSGLAQLTKLGRRAMGANYSPDGRRLAVQVDEAVQLLDIESPPASTGESLPDIGNGLFFQPDEWSRDGEFLVGASIDRTGAARGLLRYSLARRKFETLLDVQPEHLTLFPALLGDGSRLLYRDRGGIFLLDVSSRKTHLVARVSASAVHNYLAVTRDQRWIVYDEAIPEGDVWLLSFE